MSTYRSLMMTHDEGVGGEKEFCREGKGGNEWVHT